MAEEAPVLVDVAGGIMTITLNRASARNAVDRAMALALAAAMDELDGDDAVHVAIITGGGGAFCSGMDLKAFAAGERPAVEGRGFAGFVEAPPRKPLIAAVEGYALAGGLLMMIACDLAVAGESAVFGLPEVKRGLAAGAGGLTLLPRRIAPRIALEMALTGDSITAERALAVGLINAAAPDGRALAAAKTLAARISANGPLAVRASKQVITESAAWSADEMWAREAALVDPVLASEDAREGARAFAEKRAPNWKGR
ncbi:MAG: crotonase/enoyl-CoA hydratase family protein [Caulobacterales bacterium]|nr:crotonase/enoyl-CoA hydratase family protein [Caulobacterales bacterium]